MFLKKMLLSNSEVEGIPLVKQDVLFTRRLLEIDRIPYCQKWLYK